LEPAAQFKRHGEIVHEPTLDLGPDTLQLEGNELLGRLQGQVSADVASVKFRGIS
jgi:hypothetical protein